MDKYCLLFVMRNPVLFDIISQLSGNCLNFNAVNEREILEYATKLPCFGRPIDIIIVDEHYIDNITSIEEVIERIRKTSGCESAPLILLLSPSHLEHNNWSFEQTKKELSETKLGKEVDVFIDFSLNKNNFVASLMAVINKLCLKK